MFCLLVIGATSRIDRYRRTAGLAAPMEYYILPIDGCKYSAQAGHYLYVEETNVQYTIAESFVEGVPYTTVTSPGVLYLDRAAEPTVYVGDGALLLSAGDVYELSNKALPIYSDGHITKDCTLPDLEFDTTRNLISELLLPPENNYAMKSEAPCELDGAYLRCIVGQNDPEKFSLTLKVFNWNNESMGDQLVNIQALPNDISRLKSFEYIPEEREILVRLSEHMIVYPVGCMAAGEIFSADANQFYVHHYTQTRITSDTPLYFWRNRLLDHTLTKWIDGKETLELYCKTYPEVALMERSCNECRLPLYRDTKSSIQLFSTLSVVLDYTIEIPPEADLSCAFDEGVLTCTAHEEVETTVKLVLRFSAHISATTSISVTTLIMPLVAETCNVVVPDKGRAIVMPILLQSVADYNIIHSEGGECEYTGRALLCYFNETDKFIKLTVETVIREGVVNATEVMCSLERKAGDFGFEEYVPGVITGTFKEDPGENSYNEREDRYEFDMEYIWLPVVILVLLILIGLQMAAICLVCFCVPK